MNYKGKFLSIGLLCSVVCMSAVAAQENDCLINRIYIGAEGGIARATNTSLAPDWFAGGSQYYWMAIPTLPTDANAYVSNMGSAISFGAKVGFVVNEFINLDLAYNRRGNFSLATSGDVYYSADLDPTFTGGALFGQRWKPINSQAATINMNIAVPPLSWDKFKPFLSAGLGISWNKLGGLQGMQNPLNNAGFILSGNTMASFTWQLGAGIEYMITKHMAVDLAYRFVDLGNFTSGTSMNDPAKNVINGNINPFKMTHVGINEYYVTLKYTL